MLDSWVAVRPHTEEQLDLKPVEQIGLISGEQLGLTPGEQLGWTLEEIPRTQLESS